MLVRFCKSFSQLSCCSGHRLFVWQVCIVFMLFRLLVNHSASFQAIQPTFKPFGLVSKQNHFALYNWTRMKLVSYQENITHETITHSGSRQLLLTEYLLRALSVSGSKSWSSNCNQEQIQVMSVVLPNRWYTCTRIHSGILWLLLDSWYSYAAFANCEPLRVVLLFSPYIVLSHVEKNG